MCMTHGVDEWPTEIPVWMPVTRQAHGTGIVVVFHIPDVYGPLYLRLNQIQPGYYHPVRRLARFVRALGPAARVYLAAGEEAAWLALREVELEETRSGRFT